MLLGAATLFRFAAFFLTAAFLGPAILLRTAIVLGMALIVRAPLLIGAAALFRLGLLMYGKRPSLREIARQLRHA